MLFTTSVLIRLIGLDHVPAFDELYTLLAARGWLVDGVPRIADGVYERAELYTILVAQFFRAFGESLVVARLPAVLFGSLLVAAVYVWTRAVAGSTAAWIAALFLCFAPLGIEIAQFARFYALHGLLFWLAAVGVYALCEQHWSRAWKLGLALGLSLCLLVALHLQKLTVVGLVGISCWLIAVPALRWFASPTLDPRMRWITVAVLVALFAVIAVILVGSGPAEELFRLYQYSPLHNVGERNEIWYYHYNLIERYPSLWPLFPFLALLAVATNPRPALFCMWIFVGIFFVLSLAGMRHLRFFFFSTPFLFILWGIALAPLLRTLSEWVLTTVRRSLPHLAPIEPRASIGAGLIVLALLFLILANGAPARTLLRPLGITLTEGAWADWGAASESLKPWAESASIVLTTRELHALYYLDRYDVAVSASRIFELNGQEFTRDPRTGRPIISTAESLRLMLECFPDGLFIADRTSWRVAQDVDDAAANLLETRAIPIDLPPASGVLAFRWEAPGGWSRPPECDARLDATLVGRTEHPKM